MGDKAEWLNVPEEKAEGVVLFLETQSAVNAVLHSCRGLMSNTKEGLLKTHQSTHSGLLRTNTMQGGGVKITVYFNLPSTPTMHYYFSQLL